MKDAHVLNGCKFSDKVLFKPNQRLLKISQLLFLETDSFFYYETMRCNFLYQKFIITEL